MMVFSSIKIFLFSIVLELLLLSNRNLIPSCYENVYNFKKVARQNISIRSLAQCLNTQPISKKQSVEDKLKEKIIKQNEDTNKKQTSIIDESEQENSIDLNDYTNIG
ncbi:Plasmodium exported protein, unknown function [Plasmodium sp. gorilla clade G2]|uniref:Plasmodium exported protein, unknown function n=1 Tax=Plasmodium sp. gorilla clade G2 TaxID=880535 RepID=UPI000D28306C|nr:Plasmodium exported protein, unknown function [Plasmodium sp. gorilla clade G2]SOV20223.1 Plasmodium exported protein, unknown function [Plasmodium sp. gorilla clade G2]